MKKIHSLCLCLSSLIISSAAITTTVSLLENVQFTKDVNVSEKNDLMNDNQAIKTNPLDFYSSSPNLTQSVGPIISYGSKITALDWFGATLWEFDLSGKDQKYLPETTTPQNWVEYVNRGFINWSLDEKNNYLYLLTNTNKEPQSSFNGKLPPQNIIKLNSITGQVISCVPVQYHDYNSKYVLFYQIQALANGKVEVYSLGTNESWWTALLYDPITNTQKYIHEYDKERNDELWKLIWQPENKRSAEIRFDYLIPITDNVNIAVYCCFNANHFYDPTLGDLFLSLVDDNLKKIDVDPNSQWGKLIHIKQNIEDKYGYYSSNWSKTIYRTLDGKVYFTAWGKFFVFYPNLSYSGIPFQVYEFKNDKRVMSYTMDVNENVFIKYWNDPNIYKLIITSSGKYSVQFQESSYYNINGSLNPDISSQADNFVLYNVSGYTGSIMLLDASIIDNGEHFTDKPPTNQLCGIAAAIVQNPENDEYGDCIGLLNTKNSFLKASDFTISNSILNSKIPSEITVADITPLNGGFLTQNKQMVNGVLKYPQFNMDNLNDETGEFTVSVYLDQIPWFANSLPNNSIPKLISKSFKTKYTIGDKVSWKQLNDYNFKNTLASKISLDDVNNFDPFQVSFQSNVVLDYDGNQMYPKKNYSIVSKNAETGEIKIECLYEYVPLSFVYKDKSSVKSYKQTHTYYTFGEKQTPQFYFIGSDKKASSETNNVIDIRSVPELKSLVESNILPSSFLKTENENFMQFINISKTIGYPLTWMEFEVEANDNLGELIISAKVKNGYFENNKYPTHFVQKYVGLNKLSDYSFSFNKNINSINNQSLKSILPSAVTQGDIASYFIEYTGFISSDFTINLFPNNMDGKLNVEIILNKNYSEVLGNSGIFKNYIASYTFTGFMNMNEYNNQYNIEFKNNHDIALLELKKYTTLEIYQKLVVQKSGLTINGIKYNNLNDLVQNLLINYLGERIPNADWSKNPYIRTYMNFDNLSGTMAIILEIDKAALVGYSSSIVVSVEYSGFVIGNTIETGDNLTFLDNYFIKGILPNKNMTASEFGEWLKQDKKNLEQIILYVSGQYVELLKNDQYSFKYVANDVYKTITIELEFYGVKNPESLSSYSIQYIL